MTTLPEIRKGGARDECQALRVFMKSSGRSYRGYEGFFVMGPGHCGKAKYI